MKSECYATRNLLLLTLATVSIVEALKNTEEGALHSANGNTYEANFLSYRASRAVHPPTPPFERLPRAFVSRRFRQPSTYRDETFFRREDYGSQLKDFRPFYRETSFHGNGIPSGRRAPPMFGSFSSLSYRDRAPFSASSAAAAAARPFADQFAKDVSSYRQNQRYLHDLLASYPQSYEKPMDSYREANKQTEEPASFADHQEYLKYGNHGLGFASVPAFNSESLLPLDTETSTALSTTLTATHKPLADSTISSTTQTVPKVLLSSTVESRIAMDTATTVTTIQTPNVNQVNARDGMASTKFLLLPTMSTMTSTSKETSDGEGAPLSLTASSNNMSVSPTPQTPFDHTVFVQSSRYNNLLDSMPMYITSGLRNGIFSNAMNVGNGLKEAANIQGNVLSTNVKNDVHLTGMANEPYSLKSDVHEHVMNLSSAGSSSGVGVHGTPINPSPPDTKSEIRENLLQKNGMQAAVMNYMLPDESKSTAMKGDGVHLPLLKYVMPNGETKLTLKGNVPGAFMNYLESGGAQQPLKNDVPLLDYVMQGDVKHGIPLSQQQIFPLHNLNYVPIAALSAAGGAAAAAGGVAAGVGAAAKLTLPINTLPTISNSLEDFNYVRTTMPFLSSASAPTRLALGSTLTESFANGLQGSLSTNIPNIATSGIATGIPHGISTGIPTGIPMSIDFPQTFQHIGQIRPLEASPETPYSTGLQMQLGGGFDGIDYGLRSSNTASAPMELSIAKMGLSLPEFSRPHLTTYAKFPNAHGVGTFLRRYVDLLDDAIPDGASANVRRF